MSMVSVLALSLVAGCGGKKAEEPNNTATPAPEEKVTLEFWAHWASEQRRPTIDKILKTWNDTHPNIQVNYTPVPFDQITTKVQAGVAAGNAPDVVVLDTFTTQFRASKNQNTDLTQFGADSIKGEYFDAPWSANTYNGKTYGLPFVTDTRMLFYNKAAFKEAGLDPEKGPLSWDDLWKFSDKLDKKTGNKLERIGFHPLQGGGYDLWVPNGGGNFFDAKRENPTINTDPKNAEIMDWIKKWNDRYGNENFAAFKSTFQGGANDPFLTGKVAMEVNVATFAAQIKKYNPSLEYGMIPIPTPDGKQHSASAFSGGFNIELPAKTKHAKQAYEFAKYLTTDAAIVWAKEQYDMPAAKKAAQGIDDPVFKAMLNNMPNTAFQPRPLFAPDYGTAIQKAVDDVMAGKATTKAALDEAQKTVEQMIKDNKGK
jgi:multiple sugar transport system substrate-binding protein